MRILVKQAIYVWKGPPVLFGQANFVHIAVIITHLRKCCSFLPEWGKHQMGLLYYGWEMFYCFC